MMMIIIVVIIVAVVVVAVVVVINKCKLTVPSLTINWTSIIIYDNEKGTCVLTDTAISGDRNVIKKEAEKILRYKDIKTS